MDEMLPPRRTSAPGRPLLAVCKPAASIKKWLAALDHLPELSMRGWSSLLALLCGTVQKKVAKCKTLAGTCCFPECIQLKLWLHSSFPMAPFCHLCWGGLPRSPTEITVVLATKQGSGQGRKILSWIVLALLAWCLEARTIWKLHLLCLCVCMFVCVTHKGISHSSRPVLHRVESWSTAKLSPVPAGSNEKHWTPQGDFICVLLIIYANPTT